MVNILSGFHSIKKHIEKLAVKFKRDPKEITLLAVSKKRSLEEIQALYEEGCRDFGENRVFESLEKASKMPEDISWHFIGNIQSKKVPKIVGKFHLIHSVDSLKLAKFISMHSLKIGVETNLLLQVNSSGEESKQGFESENLFELFNEMIQIKGIKIKGLMTMAPLTEDKIRIRQTFSKLRELKENLERDFPIEKMHLSMGMSNDYDIAIEEGATIVRIGSAIFDNPES